jgi:hypothetical protein
MATTQEGKFNPFDPLGLLKKAKDQVDGMAVKAGLPSLPPVPGLQQRTEAERAMVHREKFLGVELPTRGTGMSQILDPLGIFNREKK